MKSLLPRIKRYVFRYVAFFLIIGILLMFSMTKRGYAQSFLQEAQYTDRFVISAYYSPLPNQTHYVTGTYEGDVRLNGEGVHSASGNIVYPGMLAAPPNIPFRTKIYIHDLGVGTVLDRGGAIQNKRLDIWMGYGEEGMSRALAWGIREVEAAVLGIKPELPDSIDLSGLPLAKNAGVYVRTRYFRHDLGLGDQGGEIEELQRFLKQLSYYKGVEAGIYDQATKEAVLAFQLDTKVISDAFDIGAGLFGPRTRYALEARIEKQKNEESAGIPEKSLKKGDKGDEVMLLQKLLVLLGYIGNASGDYDEETLKALLRFQKDRGIILRNNEFGAGVFGPHTKDALKHAVFKRWIPKEEKIVIPERHRFNAEQAANVFNKPLKKGDKGSDIERLQEELYRLNFLRVEPTGYFGKVTEHAVFKFQQAMGIVKTEKDSGAGLVGPKTREKLHEFISKRESQNKLIAETTKKKQVVSERIAQEHTLIASAKSFAVIPGTLKYGMENQEVRKLQELLKTLGYFPGHITSDYFGDITRQSVTSFQIQHAIIKTEDEEGAGEYDEKTREVLQKIFQG